MDNDGNYAAPDMTVVNNITQQFRTFEAQTHEKEITKLLAAEGIELQDEQINASALENLGYMMVRDVKDGVHTVRLLKIVQTTSYKINLNLNLTAEKED